jgi:Protein of unknown function (DUF998)
MPEMSLPSRNDRIADVALAFALAVPVIFALVCAVAQVAREDLDPVRVPLSAYLSGAGGWAVRGVYYGLGTSLVVFAWISFHATLRVRRSATAAAMFAIAGLALIPVAVTANFVGDSDAVAELAALIHGIAAQTAFVCVTSAMLLQAWLWRGDPRLAVGALPHAILALLAFVGLWIHVLNRSLPRGASQKAVIALILIWQLWACVRIWRVQAVVVASQAAPSSRQ